MIRVQIKSKRYRFKTIREAANAFGMPSIPIRNRVRLGWTLSKAISTPLRGYKFKKPYVPKFQLPKRPTHNASAVIH